MLYFSGIFYLFISKFNRYFDKSMRDVTPDQVKSGYSKYYKKLE